MFFLPRVYCNHFWQLIRNGTDFLWIVWTRHSENNSALSRSRSGNANIGWCWPFQIMICFMVHCIMPSSTPPTVPQEYTGDEADISWPSAYHTTPPSFISEWPPVRLGLAHSRLPAGQIQAPFTTPATCSCLTPTHAVSLWLFPGCPSTQKFPAGIGPQSPHEPSDTIYRVSRCWDSSPRYCECVPSSTQPTTLQEYPSGEGNSLTQRLPQFHGM